MSTIHKYLTPDDFVIILTPVKDDFDREEMDQWTGEVQVSILTNVEKTTLTEDEFRGMLLLCNFAAASIPAMEENSFVRELVQSYAQKNMLSLVPDEDDGQHGLTADSCTKGSA